MISKLVKSVIVSTHNIKDANRTLFNQSWWLSSFTDQPQKGKRSNVKRSNVKRSHVKRSKSCEEKEVMYKEKQGI